MEIKPLHYIYGTEGYLVEETLKEIKKAALSGGFESMNYHVFDGKGVSATEVISVASTFPAFSDKRVIVVKGADTIKADEEKEFLEYAKDPMPTTCLVFLSDAGKIDKGSAFLKLLGDKGYLTPCNRLKERELVGWIRKYVREQKKMISEDAAERLVALAGESLREVKGELDKIILFAGDKAEITGSDVEDAGLDCREETLFGLSDAIGNKDLKKAMKIYAKVSDEAAPKVLGAIARQMRTLLQLKVLLRKKVPAPQIAGKLHIPQWHIESYTKRSRLFTEKELKAALVRLNAADLDFKTGRMPEGLIMPGLIMELSGGK